MSGPSDTAQATTVMLGQFLMVPLRIRLRTTEIALAHNGATSNVRQKVRLNGKKCQAALSIGCVEVLNIRQEFEFDIAVCGDKTLAASGAELFDITKCTRGACNPSSPQRF